MGNKFTAPTLDHLKIALINATQMAVYDHLAGTVPSEQETGFQKNFMVYSNLTEGEAHIAVKVYYLTRELLENNDYTKY